MRHNLYFPTVEQHYNHISKLLRKYITKLIGLYSACDRQVYHITNGCFQWGTCETVIGMGMGNNGMEGGAQDQRWHNMGQGATDLRVTAGRTGGEPGVGTGQHTPEERT